MKPISVRTTTLPIAGLFLTLASTIVLNGCDDQTRPADGSGQVDFGPVLTISPPEEYYDLSKDEFLASREHDRKTREKTIGYVVEGRWGELLWCDETFATSAQTIRVVRANKELELVRREANGEFTLLGSVDNAGNYTSSKMRVPEIDTSRAPRKWDMTAVEKMAKEVPVGTSVFSSIPKASARPANAVGWLFITRYSLLVTVSVGVEPPLDVIWVVTKADGLELVHSGPTNSGLYAQVDLNGNIHFDVPFAGALNDDWTNSKWTLLNADSEPVFTDIIKVLPERLELEQEFIVAPGGVGLDFKGMPEG